MSEWWEIVEWHGQSGRTYLYTSVPIGTRLTDEPGNYLYACADEYGMWRPLFAGATESLERSVPPGEELPTCVREHGGTHVHFRRNMLGDIARAEEREDLIARWGPPCNEG